MRPQSVEIDPPSYRPVGAVQIVSMDASIGAYDQSSNNPATIVVGEEKLAV